MLNELPLDLDTLKKHSAGCLKKTFRPKICIKHQCEGASNDVSIGIAKLRIHGNHIFTHRERNTDDKDLNGRQI